MTAGFGPVTEEDIPYADLSFLVVDDNQIMRQLLQHAVASSGANKIDVAADFNTALHKLKARNRYDVVLCDYILNDDRDGQQLLEEARRNNLLPPTSVWIMVTGESAYHQVFSAAELLPDDYLIKPIKPGLLHERIMKARERARVLGEANKRLYAGDYAGCVKTCLATLTYEKRYVSDLQRIAGEAMLRGGEIQRAHDFFVQLLQSGKDYPWLKLGLARAYFHLKRTDQSNDILESLILDSPEYLQAHDWMARIQEEMGRPEVAKEILAETLRKNPKALWRHREIVRVAVSTEDYATAATAYEALHQHGRGSSFLTPGDFSGYAMLLASKPIADADSKTKVLAANLQTFFARDNRFDFARGAVEFARAARVGDRKGRQAAYAAMKFSASRAVESNDKLALLNAALEEKDREAVEEIAAGLFLDHDGNDRMLKQIRDLFPKDLRHVADRVQQRAAEDMKNLIARAIEMARGGDLEGAVKEFDRLARERPSPALLYNAGVAVAKWIEARGWDPEKGRMLDRHIRALQGIDPGSTSLKRLNDFRACMPQ